MAVRAPGRNAAMRCAERRQHVAADDDVIGAIAERDIDRDRMAECFSGAVMR